MRCIRVVRVAGREPARERPTVGAQVRAVRDRCAQHGHEAVKVVVLGESTPACAGEGVA